MQITLKLITFLALTTALVIVSAIFIGLDNSAFAQADLSIPEKTTEPVKSGSLADNPIIEWIEFFINLLTVIIVVGAVIMLAVAGVQYTSSRDNSQATQAAKDKIFNVLLGLVAYFFLYGFVQWLIPGGVF